MDKSGLLESIKEKFSKYKTYYEILGINSNEATDEKVRTAYNNRCIQLIKMLRGCDRGEVQEVRELIQTTFDDAYTALKTENSRKNYNELLRKIKSEPKSEETEK